MAYPWTMTDSLIFFAALLSALPLVVGYGVLASVHFRRRPRASPARAALTLAFVAWPLTVLGWTALLVVSGPSTAVIAAVYGPLLATLVGAVVFLLAWAPGILWQAVRPAGRPRPGAVRSGVAVATLPLLSWAFAATVAGWLPVYRVAAADGPERLGALAREPGIRDHPAALKVLASHPQTPPDVLLDLARQPDPELRDPRASWLELLGFGAPAGAGSVLERVAAHPRAPAEALRELAGEPSPVIAVAVAGNPRTTPALLARLAERPGESVQLAVSGNPRTPVQVLRRLAQEGSPAVRGVVANSGRLDADLLRALAEDSAWQVRSAVALNPIAPPEVLRDLAADPDDRVRFYVATNPATPAAVLRGLTDDPDEKVSRHADRRLRDPPEG